MTDYTPTEMMTIAAARALRNERRLLRRHRRAVGGLQSGAADARARHHADLRVRHDRHQARRAAALDRRRRTVRDRAHHGVGAGDVPLLAAGRPHHRRLPRRRADRPLRQSQHHGGRRLRQAEGAAARRRRRAGDRQLAAARSSSSWRRRKRSFVEKLDFVTSFGHGEGGDHRARLGIKTKGPTKLITDLCDLRARPGDQGNDGRRRSIPASRASRSQANYRLAGALRRQGRARRRAPTAHELQVLRDLHARTAARARRSGIRRLIRCPKPSSATPSARRSAATAARSPRCAPTISPPCRSRR